MCSKESVAWSALGFIFRLCCRGRRTRMMNPFGHLLVWAELLVPVLSGLCLSGWTLLLKRLCPEMALKQNCREFHKDQLEIYLGYVQASKSSKLLEMHSPGQMGADWRNSGYWFEITLYAIQGPHYTCWVRRAGKALWKPFKCHHASLIGADERSNQSEKDKT